MGMDVYTARTARNEAGEYFRANVWNPADKRHKTQNHMSAAKRYPHEKKHGKKYVTRSVDGGVRVWRVE